MVGTRPKNKLGRIPHGTKIDLTSPKKKPSSRKKLAMEDVASPTKSGEKKKESPPGVDVDLLLGLSAGEGTTPTLAEAEQPEKGADQTPAGAEDAGTPEKEKTSTPPKGKQTSSSSSLRKVKAESSAAASSPAETEVEGSEEEASEGEASEEVNSSEAGEEGDEKEADEEEEGTDEDEPPAKRAKTPSQAKEKETVTTAKKGLAGRKIIVPKRLDFDALEELGVAKTVREKFANIGWEKFLDLDTTAYTELVREFFKKLKVVVKGAEGPSYIEFTLMGKRERLTPNQINSELEVTNVLKMITNEFSKAVKQIPSLTKDQWNNMWALVAKEEEFTTDTGKAISLKTPTLRICHRILAINFFGKKDNGNAVSYNELYILWAMEKKQELNFGCFVAGQLKAIMTKANQRLSLAHLPTLIAKKHGYLDDAPVMQVEKGGVLDLASLSRMFPLKKDNKGKMKMVKESDKPPARSTRASAKSRQTSSATPEPAQEDHSAALAKIQATVDEIKTAQLAFFAHVGFRYHPSSP